MVGVDGPRETPADRRALAEFYRQIRSFLKVNEVETRAAGIEPQQHHLLVTVAGLPEGERPTIRTLAARLYLAHPTVVELVDRLQQKGLVNRAQSPTDGREVLVRITPAGKRLLRRLAAVHRQELHSIGPHLVEALQAILQG